MLVTIGKKLCSKVCGLSKEFASAMAPISNAEEVLTAKVSVYWDMRLTTLTPFWTKSCFLAPLSIWASTGSKFAKTPIQDSKI